MRVQGYRHPSLADPAHPLGAVLLFFFHGHGNSADCGEPNLIALRAGDEAAINEVVMTLVASLATALFGQLDPIAFDLSTVPT